MAATAYASLVSLLNTIDQIHTHPLVSTFFDINLNKSLSEKVNFLVDFVEKYSDPDSREVEDLVTRIADAAHEAENIIEVHAADRIRSRESPSFLHNLQVIIEKMDSIEGEVVKVKEETGKSPSFLTDLTPSSSFSLSSSSSSAMDAALPATDEATRMVGFDDYKHKLLDDLIEHDDGRQIISITGMGGIGKTTLARNLYENSLTLRHFNVRVWITVSQDSSARKVYLQALSCLGGGSIDMNRVDDLQLSVALHKTLFNRRYLIVLDDVWGVEIWDKIKFYFPENRNGSRIVVTTRESKLVDYIGSSALALKFLDKENSWKLFREKTYPQQAFPFELEEVGKKIVKNCGGLPLAITVIGGLLGKSPKTQEYWEKVAKDKSLILNSGEYKPSNILYLSYKYLPVHLKSCFLYLGLYPEDSVIDESKVIKLWIAEGFIKVKRGQSLEEVAKCYFNDLVDRNLLLLRYIGPRWKTCSIHDLLREVCINIGEKENFYSVQRSVDETRHFIANQGTRRFYPQESFVSRKPSILHPLVVRAGERAAPVKTRLLRVFYCDERSPYYALQEVNMRFLQDLTSKEHDYLLPSLVSRFWSLQTLIVGATTDVVVAPVEIWNMPQLRHIIIWNLSLPNPPPPLSDDDVCFLQNLQTLKRVKNLIFTEDVCKRIPNIKKLHIKYDLSSQSGECPCYHPENLGCFNKLEFLEYDCNILDHAGDTLQNIKFPSSLKELTLGNCKLEWSYMAVIALLPHLQYLNIGWDAIPATKWIFVDEKFVSLKHLRIIHCDHVSKWIAQSSNFPVLEKLSIWHLSELSEIPSGIGEIPTLQSIYLSGCSESANISVVEILHEQERFGNLGLRVAIRTDEAELLREEIQQLGLTCQNLVINDEPY